MTWLLSVGGTLLGAILGSYIATLVVRWPEGGQASKGRSRCDNCHKKLRPAELIPLLSYALQRGRCRRCNARIPPLHPLIEAAAALVGGASLLASPSTSGAALALFGWLLLPLGLLDWRHFWLPDRLTAVLAATGLLVGGWLLGSGLADRLAGGLAGFASLFLIAAVFKRARGTDGLGAGDPKLLGAIGLWTGWLWLPLILVASAGAGLGVALVQRKERGGMLPFGTMLSAGGWCVSLAVLAMR